MIVERVSDKGLTQEIWTFDLRGQPLVWHCTEYIRGTRRRKTAKTWTQTHYLGAFPEYRAGRGVVVLECAPIDPALIAEVRLRAAEAPVVGKWP